MRVRSPSAPPQGGSLTGRASVSKTDDPGSIPGHPVIHFLRTAGNFIGKLNTGREWINARDAKTKHMRSIATTAAGVMRIFTGKNQPFIAGIVAVNWKEGAGRHHAGKKMVCRGDE